MSATDQTHLRFEGGPNDGDTVALQSHRTTLGRQTSNDVVVPEQAVSRRHAEIVKTEDGYSLQDLSSTNGTFLNGEKLEGEALLKDDDRVRLGDTEVSLVFQDPTAATVQFELPTATQPDTTAVKTAETSVVQLGEIEDAIDPDRPSGELADPATATGDPSTGVEDLYEGTVRLNLQAEGNMALVINLTQQLREKPEMRLLRLANNPAAGVDIWLGLRQPVPLRPLLRDLAGVAEVSQTGAGDGEEPLVKVLLR